MTLSSRLTLLPTRLTDAADALDLQPNELLKLRLLANGLRVSTDVRDKWRDRFDGPLTLAEYATTSGVSLRLAGGLYVNAPIVNDQRAASLCWDHDGLAVRWAGRRTPVTPVPVPAYRERTLVDRLDGVQRPYSSYGVTHTDRCRISPIAGCAWRCRFCDLPYELAYRRKHPDDLLEVVHAAASDPLAPARHVLVSGGTPRRADEPWMDRVLEHIAAQSSLPVEVMMAPRRDCKHPAWLQSVGVQRLSVNIEVSDSNRLRDLAPAKARYGRSEFLRYIEAAVDAFGVGEVQSLIVFGAAIEPLSSTLGGVRDLVERGCIPVLSPFRPHHLTPLAHASAATFEEVLDVYSATNDICVKAGNKVRPGPRCSACHHNTATLPDDSGFYERCQDC